MLRLLGGIMIVSGCLGMGIWYRESFLGRLEALRSLARIMELLVGEIRYGRATLPECCRHIAKRLKEPYRSCFNGIYKQMQENTGLRFGQVFGEHMDRCLRSLPLAKEDKRCLMTLFAEEEFEDEAMQIRSIEQCKEMLQYTVNKLEKENTEKCRLAVGLGVMSGLLLVIILF